MVNDDTSSRKERYIMKKSNLPAAIVKQLIAIAAAIATTVSTVAAIATIPVADTPAVNTVISDVVRKETSVDAKTTVKVPNRTVNANSSFRFTQATGNMKKNGQTPYVFDFTKSASVGITHDGTAIASEGDYGIRTVIDKTIVSVSLYANDGKTHSIKSVVVTDDKSKVNSKTNDNITFDAKNFRNGLYNYTVKFDTGKSLTQSFYCNNHKVWLCQTSYQKTDFDNFNNRRSIITKLMKEQGITPENSLDISNIAYPLYPYEGLDDRCDTYRWSNFSHKLVKDSWTDEHKLYVIHDWVTSHMSYDFYRTDVINRQREFYFDEFDGTWSAWNTDVGVCFDFSHIILIMCRENGIPANVVESPSHQWLCVYLNGRWAELDPTMDVERAVYSYDVTDVTDASKKYCYDGYFNTEDKLKYFSNISTVNADLWTCSRATSGTKTKMPSGWKG